MAVHLEYVKHPEAYTFPVVFLQCAEEKAWNHDVEAVLPTVATKTFDANFNEVSAYNCGTFFEYHEIHFNDLEGLYNCLVDLQDAPKVFCIAGTALPIVDKYGEGKAAWVQKTSVLKEDQIPFFECAPKGRYWVGLDLDHIEAPEGLNLIDHTEQCEEHAISLLPEYFHNVGRISQLSNSAGKNPKKIKLHLFFEFETPVHDSELIFIANRVNNAHKAKVSMVTPDVDPKKIPALIDVSAFKAVQPFYIAAPRFQDDSIDPFKGKRLRFVKKDKMKVTVPPIEMEVIKAKAKEKYDAIEVGNISIEDCKGKGLMFSQWYIDALENIGHTCGYNGPYRAAKAYTQQVGLAITDPTALAKDIAAHIQSLKEEDLTNGYTMKYLMKKCSSYAITTQVKNGVRDGEIARLKYLKNKEILEDAKKMQPKQTKGLMPVAEGTKKLIETYSEFFSPENNDDYLACITSGMGKSSTVAEVCRDKYWVGDREGPLHYYAHNHQAGYDFKNMLEYRVLPNGKRQPTGMEVVCIYGRDYAWEDRLEYIEAKAKDPKYKDSVYIDYNEVPRQMCFEKEAVKILSEKGYAIFPNMCMTKRKVMKLKKEYPIKTPTTGVWASLKKKKPVDPLAKGKYFYTDGTGIYKTKNPVFDEPEFALTPKAEKDWYMEEVKCQFFEKCGYIKQYWGDYIWDGKVGYSHFQMPKYDAFVYMSAVLGMDRGFLDFDPAEVIADESVYQYLLGGTKADDDGITFDELDKAPISSKLKQVFRSTNPDAPLLKYLRTAMGEKVIIKELKNALKIIKGSEGKYSLIEEAVGYKADLAKLMPTKSRAGEMFQALLWELEAVDRDICHSVGIKKKEINKEIIYFPAFEVQYQKSITRTAGAKTLYLNADHQPLTQSTINPDTKIVNILVPRNIHLVQVYDKSVSKSQLLKSLDDYAQHFQALVDSKGTDIKLLLMAPQVLTGNRKKGLKPKVTVNSNSWGEHYGYNRGFDHWKECEEIILISDNNPSYASVMKLAKATHFLAKEPIIDSKSMCIKVEERYTTKTGFSRTVSQYVYLDPRVQEIKETISQCEVIQGMDRGRHVHSATRKKVTVFTNARLDRIGGELPDNLISYSEGLQDDTKLNYAWNKSEGILNLSNTYLAKSFPELGNVKDWEHYFERDVAGCDHSGKSILALRNSILKPVSETEHLQVFKYSLKSGGQPLTVLSSFDKDHTFKVLSEQYLLKK